MNIIIIIINAPGRELFNGDRFQRNAGMPGVLVAAILDYDNIMLPHVNADDPIGFVIMLRSEL